MILKEGHLRELVASFLNEDLKFNGPYNDDFNISGVNENEAVIDLTEKQSAKVYRFSRILEALTNPDRQNVAAWKYVAEQMLETEILYQQILLDKCPQFLETPRSTTACML